MKTDESFKICVSGAHETLGCGQASLDMAHEIGTEIAKHGHVLTSGAVTGFPMWAAKGARENGGTTIGFSPAANAREHADVYKLPQGNLDLVVYTGFGYSGADLMLMRSSDAVIFGCGRVGTIHEFSIAFQEGKPIGILEGDWDTDELLREIISKDTTRDHDLIVFDSDPKRLLEQLIKKIKK
ncbi:MAG: hypothetical protein OEX08_03565 [Candidatus Nomurabacteria bacterium]|nr:hypothetical protein [Candidatus Nomurabacteria bacterium]